MRIVVRVSESSRKNCLQVLAIWSWKFSITANSSEGAIPTSRSVTILKPETAPKIAPANASAFSVTAACAADPTNSRDASTLTNSLSAVAASVPSTDAVSVALWAMLLPEFALLAVAGGLGLSFVCFDLLTVTVLVGVAGRDGGLWTAPTPGISSARSLPFGPSESCFPAASCLACKTSPWASPMIEFDNLFGSMIVHRFPACDLQNGLGGFAAIA